MSAIEISQQLRIGILMRIEIMLVNKDDVERFELFLSPFRGHFECKAI